MSSLFDDYETRLFDEYNHEHWDDRAGGYVSDYEEDEVENALLGAAKSSIVEKRDDFITDRQFESFMDRAHDLGVEVREDV